MFNPRISRITLIFKKLITETQRIQRAHREYLEAIFFVISVSPLAPLATVRAANTVGTRLRDGRAGVWFIFPKIREIREIRG